jgi:anti-sigma factor RsiW
MTEGETPITEHDLHAYVDGQVDVSRRRQIDQYLQDHPDTAQTVAAYQKQRDYLRAAFATVGIAPLPERLQLETIISERLRQRSPPWRLVAMVVLGIGLGGATGWYLHAPVRGDRTTRAIEVLRQEALASYAVYSTDRRHPIEVTAAEEGHLRQWLSNRLNKSVAPPDLSGFGYKLLGGRLLATEQGRAAALFMYEGSNGERLSLVIRPMLPKLHSDEFDFAQGSVSGCGWIENGLGYALVADASERELDRIADHIKAGPDARTSQPG